MIVSPFIDQESDEYESPFTLPKSGVKRIFWVLMLPVSCLYFLTIPNCRRPGCWQKTFVVSFLMSIIWIAGLSYIMVWMVVIAGKCLKMLFINYVSQICNLDLNASKHEL